MQSSIDRYLENLAVTNRLPIAHHEALKRSVSGRRGNAAILGKKAVAARGD